MSGGELNYGYNYLNSLLDDIKSHKIEFNDNDLTKKEEHIIINEIKSIKSDLKKLSERAKNLEWWLSGDYGDKTYFETIKKCMK